MNATSSVLSTDSSSWIVYFVGAIIALLILGYLVYSLVKPEKF
jgi:K+-transporting ATPase KdpF subunit